MSMRRVISKGMYRIQVLMAHNYVCTTSESYTNIHLNDNITVQVTEGKERTKKRSTVSTASSSLLPRLIMQRAKVGRFKFLITSLFFIILL